MYYYVNLGLLFASAIVSAVLAAHVWRLRRVPGAFPAIGMMLGVAAWCCGYIYEQLNPGLSTQLASNYISYLGIVGVPIMFFMFALKYSGYSAFLKRRNVLLLSILPLITMVLVWTSNYHTLMWYDARVETAGPFSVIIKTYGVWFWVQAAYNYSLLAIAMVVIMRRLFRLRRLYRGQAIALLICVLVPLAWNVLHVSRLWPGPRVDFTPSAFTISCIAMALGLFRFRLLDIAPVARDTVVENMNDGVIVLDKRDRLVDFNPAAQRIVNYPLTILIGEPAERVFSLHPDLLNKWRGVTQANTEVVIGEGETQRYYELSISPLGNKSRGVAGRVLVLRDVTEHKKMERIHLEQSDLLNKQNVELRLQGETLAKQRQELIDKTHELEKASSAKSDFLANMSHELRTPLSAVIGFSELMLDGVPGPINEEQKQSLTDIYNSGQHLLKLINDVLDLSRVESGRVKLNIEDTDLYSVIDEVTNSMTPIFDKNKLSLEMGLEEGLPKVRADEGKLRQVFINLLSNATKFTQPGGTIRIEARRDGDYCQVSVIDTGIGIKKEDYERIFEAFTQGETLPGREREGTGLGLRLCKQFVELMGGRIWVESEYGKGSRFSFTLPVVK